MDEKLLHNRISLSSAHEDDVLGRVLLKPVVVDEGNGLSRTVTVGQQAGIRLLVAGILWLYLSVLECMAAA